jgi:hypothetical protein
MEHELSAVEAGVVFSYSAPARRFFETGLAGTGPSSS